MKYLEKIEELEKLIAQYDEDDEDEEDEDEDEYDDDGNFGDGISIEEIKAAEIFLGFEFSPSYKWWLENYCTGMIGDREIYGVFAGDYDEALNSNTMYSGEIVINYTKKQDDKDKLEVFRDSDVAFYFNLNEKDDENEYKIYEKFSGQKFADNFIDFLIKLLEGKY